MRRFATPLAIAIVIAVHTQPASALTPTVVIDSPGDETLGALSDGWTAWSASTLGDPDSFAGYIQPAGGDPIRVPYPGDVWVGTIATDGPHAGQLVFQTAGVSDIEFLDLATQRVLPPPDGVNTRRREYNPSVSGDALFFGRGPALAALSRKLLLYRFSTGTFTTVASSDRAIYQADQVNGDFASYTRCIKRACDVFRYRISTGRTMKIPSAITGRANYWSAVSKEGVMYWVEGRAAACGRRTQILTWGGDGIERVLRVPDGIELLGLEAGVVDGQPTLLFDELKCATNDYGVYEVPV